MPLKTQAQDQAPRGQRDTKPPELAIWKMMIQRCHNPRYAGSKMFGVPICERWLGPEGFANFVADVGPQPFPGAGLRRLDDCKPFEPGNVAWGDTRAKHMLTHDGRTMSLADWAKEIGMHERTLRERFRRGWSVESMLTWSVRRQFPYYGQWAQYHAMKAKNQSLSGNDVTAR